MSIAIANLLCLIPIERVAIGGGFSKIGKPLIDRIKKYTKEREFISNIDRYDIVLCELGDAVVLKGAVLLASQKVKEVILVG